MAKRPPPRTSFRTLPAPRENPVQVAELVHLTRTRKHGSSRLLLWLLVLVFAVAVALGGVLYLMGRSGNIGGTELIQRYETFRQYLFLANTVLAVLALTAGPVMVLETLLLGSDGIAREQRSGTWDLLALTRLTGWQIVTGKWRAVQSFVYRYYGGLMLARVLAFVWVNLSWSGGSSTQTSTDIAALLMGLTIVAGFGALNIALAGASALLASFRGGTVTNFGVAVAVQLAAALLLAVANILVFRPLLSGFDGYELLALSSMVLAPLDGGMMAGSQLHATPRAVTALAVYTASNAALLGLMVFGLLRLAHWLAVRQGAAR